MRYATLCSGVEGFGQGFDAAGMECVYQNEIDKQCRMVLRRHYPDVERGTDVNDESAAESLRRLRPDVVAFGFPCQDLSVAGLRAGLAGERSSLFFRCARLAAECDAGWVVVENVPGLLSSNDGRDMGIVLGTMGELGYGWAYRVLDAQYCGVAQRRKRVFIVGCLGDARRAAEVLFESESVCWDNPPSREKGARVAASITAGSGVSSNNPGRRREDDVNLVFSELGEGRSTFQEAEVTGAIRGNGGGGIHANLVAFGGNNTRGPIDVAACCNAKASVSGRQDFESETFIAYQCHGSNVGPLGAIRSGNGNETGGVPFLQHGMAVRRLLPIEEERLFGWPDDWTRYGIDDKGGTVEMSDSARYRMIGNGVVKPCAEWIARRILESHFE